MDYSAKVAELIQEDRVRVPPYPSSAMRIQRILSGGDFGLGELVEVMKVDQGLTADILRLANSPFYRRGQPVTSLSTAVAWIGAQELQRLAIASGLSAQANLPGPLATARRQAWHDGLASALICEQLSRSRQLRGEDAFVCGLLHDFGRVVTFSCAEELLKADQGQPPRSFDDWSELADLFHLQLGALLASRWGLPKLLADAMTLHHAAKPQGAQEPRLLEVVCLSDRVVALMNRRSHITAQALSEFLPDASERAAIARLLPAIPQFVASFERVGDVPPATSRVLGAALADPTQRPVSFPVAVQGRAGGFQAVGMGLRSLVLEGSAPLSEQGLVELTLDCPPAPFVAWGKVRTCAPLEGGGYKVDVAPYVMSDEVLQEWTARVQAARS